MKNINDLMTTLGYSREHKIIWNINAKNLSDHSKRMVLERLIAEKGLDTKNSSNKMSRRQASGLGTKELLKHGGMMEIEAESYLYRNLICNKLSGDKLKDQVIDNLIERGFIDA